MSPSPRCLVPVVGLISLLKLSPSRGSPCHSKIAPATGLAPWTARLSLWLLDRLNCRRKETVVAVSSDDSSGIATALQHLIRSRAPAYRHGRTRHMIRGAAPGFGIPRGRKSPMQHLWLDVGPGVRSDRLVRFPQPRLSICQPRQVASLRAVRALVASSVALRCRGR